MNDIIWVEILRNRSVVARHRCTGGVVRIGRGYGNDVVLDDPQVAAEHVRIERDATGALVAVDLGSRSGMFADDQRLRRPRIVLDGTRVVRIGNTYFRVRDAAYPVPAELPAAPGRSTWPLAAALAVILLALTLGSLWLDETAKPQASAYLVPILILALLALGWTGLWALLSHVFSGQARFVRHLLICLAGLLVYGIASLLDTFAAFSLARHMPAAGRSVCLWLGLAVVCFLHLRTIGPGRAVQKAGAVAVLAGVAIAIQLLTVSALRGDGSQSDLARRLFPPSLRLAQPRTADAFFHKVERLKTELDRARTKPP